jgi:hypothetical protein
MRWFFRHLAELCFSNFEHPGSVWPSDQPLLPAQADLLTIAGCKWKPGGSIVRFCI